MSTETDEREREVWTQRPRMTKDQKLELIREMKAQLMSEETQPLDGDTL